MISTLFAGLVAAAGLASALPQTTPSTDRSCQQLGSGSQVGLYTVTCGADRPSGDLSNAQASSFSACIPLCDQLPGCVGFAYTGGSGAGFCYFKSSLTSQVDAPNVDVAVKPVTSSPATTSSAPISTTAVTAAPTSTAGPSCQQLGTGAQVGAYTTECQTDRPGGDLSNAPAASFSACFAQCDQLADCVGFSYVGGSDSGVCYFKSNLTPPSANQGVDTAVKSSALSSSSSSSTSTTTRSTTPVQVPTTTPAAPTTTPAAPTTTTRAVTTTPAAPTTTPRSTTTSSISIPTPTFPTIPTPTFPTISIPTTLPTTLSTTTSRAATTTTTRASTTTTAPASTPTNGLFCTKYVFGVPVIVLCNTIF
ncbi:putative PAN/Apple domain-containing protein [Septoria linicola]|nr:putative PAN/Apple domain-containing protein [Septoria linicola]